MTEIRDKIMNARGAYTTDHLLALYRMCEDEASKKEFVAMLTWKYRDITDTSSTG